MATRPKTAPVSQDQKRQPVVHAKAYQTPKLVRYGRVEGLTQGSLSGTNDAEGTRRFTA